MVLKHEGYSGYTKKPVNEKKIIDAHGQKLKSVVRNKEIGTKKIPTQGEQQKYPLKCQQQRKQQCDSLTIHKKFLVKHPTCTRLGSDIYIYKSSKTYTLSNTHYTLDRAR